MSLNNALMIASQSLGTISSQISLVSRNISSAETDSATKKTSIITTGVNGGSEFKGVRRETNEPIFRNLLATNSRLAASARMSDALDQIDLNLNLSDPSESRTPALLISRLSDTLISYSSNPDDRTSAELVLQAAREVVITLRESSRLTHDLRIQADENIANSVKSINEILNKIHALNQDIISFANSGIDATDIMDRRDNFLKELSVFIGIKTVTRPNQDLVIYADNGATLLETSPRSVSFQRSTNLFAGEEGLDIYIDGVQSTGPGTRTPLISGMIVGDLTIRDELAPIYQAQLDEIARVLISNFSEKDQSGDGNPPLPGLFTVSGSIMALNSTLISGLSDKITINPSVDPDQGGDSMLLRDGGISGNAKYIYNKDESVGFKSRILELAGSISINNNFDTKAGLNYNGTLRGFSEASIGWIGAQRQKATREKTYENAIVTQSISLLSSLTGVNVDEQVTIMLSLENSFQASARLLQTINSIYDSLFAAIN